MPTETDLRAIAKRVIDKQPSDDAVAIASAWLKDHPRWRRFVKKGGFEGDSECLEYIDGGMWLVMKDGSRNKCDSAYTICDCLRIVSDGVWAMTVSAD
jgi:hypothetical protein